MDYDLIKEFIEPELLVLIPVLYAIGMGLKKTEKVKNNFIPIILGISGIILAGLWCISSAELSNVQQTAACLFAALTQGILCASGSVFVDQVIKQSTFSKKES